MSKKSEFKGKVQASACDAVPQSNCHMALSLQGHSAAMVWILFVDYSSFQVFLTRLLYFETVSNISQAWDPGWHYGEVVEPLSGG